MTQEKVIIHCDGWLSDPQGYEACGNKIEYSQAYHLWWDDIEYGDIVQKNFCSRDCLYYFAEMAR